jgi:hypothetical protein
MKRGKPMTISPVNSNSLSLSLSLNIEENQQKYLFCSSALKQGDRVCPKDTGP